VVRWILTVVVEHLIVEVAHRYEMVLEEGQVYYRLEERALSWKVVQTVLMSCLAVEVLNHLMVWEV